MALGALGGEGVVGVLAVVEGVGEFLKNFNSMNDAVSGFGRQVDDTAGRLSPFGRALEFVGDVIRRVAEIALAIVAVRVLEKIAEGLLAMAKAAIEAASNFQLLQIRLEGLIARDLVKASGGTLSFADALEQAAGMAQELFIWVQKLAIATPFSTQQIANVVTLAESYGFGVEMAKALTEATVNFTAAMGLSDIEMIRIIENLGQMAQAGKITGTELRDLARGAFVPINDVLDRTAELMGITREELDKLRKQGLAPVEPFLQAFIDLVGEEFPGAGERMVRTFAGMQERLKDLAETLFGFALIKPILDTLAGAAADFFDAFFAEGRFEALVSIFQDLGRQIGFLVGDLLGLTTVDPEALFKGIAIWILRITEAIRQLRQGDIAGAFNILGLERLLEIFQKISSAVGAAAGSPLVVGIIEDVTGALANLKLFFDQNAQGILDALGRIVSALLGGAGEAATGIAQKGILTQLTDLLVQAGPGIINMLNIIADTIEQKLLPGLRNFGKWIADNKDTILGIFTGLAVAFGVLAVAGTIVVVALAVVAGAFLAVIAAMTLLVAYLGIAFLAFLTFVDDWLRAGADWSAGVILSVSEFVTGTINLLGGWVGQVALKFLEALKQGEQTLGRWRVLGQNIVLGLIKGMQDNFHKFLAFIKDLVEAAWEIIKKFFGLSSPSRLMIEAGENIMAGWAQGLEAGMGAVVDAMQMAASASAQAPGVLAGAMGGVAGNTTNNTYNYGLTVNSSAEREPLLADFDMLETLAGA